MPQYGHVLSEGAWAPRTGGAPRDPDIVHHLADATRLPLRSGSCHDASRSERLFQHLSDPAAALAELLRVTRRGGWVVVLDTDWGTLSLHSPEIEIERRLARVHADHLLHNGYAGRQIYHLFKRQGVADLRVAVYPVYAAGPGAGSAAHGPRLRVGTRALKHSRPKGRFLH